jgi:hypothetical protein
MEIVAVVAHDRPSGCTTRIRRPSASPALMTANGPAAERATAPGMPAT